VNIPIVMLGNDLRIRRFTPHAEKLLNIVPADVGRPISDFRIKINTPDLVAWCQEVLDSLTPKEREVQDTEGRAYSMWVRPYRTADNRIEGLVLTLLDITERKQAAEARFRRLFEAAKDGTVIADAATGVIVDVNPFVAKRFGYARARLVGQKLWESDLFRDTEINESMCHELQDRESVQRILTLPAASGEQVEVEIVASLYAEGERRVIQCNIRDISARRQIEEKERRNEEQVRQAQKMEAVGRLAGGVAHDFNNLMTAISGFAELLGLELGENPRAREMLGQIQVGAGRATALTKQLLAFGRKQIVAPTVLDVNETIAEMRQMASVVLTESVELALELQPDVGRVRADRTQMEQVLLNLVLNARDAMPDGGRITVSTANVDADESFSGRHPAVPVGHYVAVSVNDTGTGMSEETQSHLFEPFFTTKAKGMGVGLGLATTCNIVKECGGYIWAYSELGVGSTFTVYLPRVEPEPTAAAGPPPRREQLRGSETILLVDDEAAVRALARRFLELQGYTVLEARNGPEALRASREYKGPIHLMVADVAMPRMSGRELAFLLAPERPETKVLYISGHTEDAIIHHGVLDNEMAFLAKPFTQQAFAVKVRHLLDGGQAPERAAGKN
jgi:PAS domain S-box-containing protein